MMVFFSTILATEKMNLDPHNKIPNHQKISPTLIINLSLIILIQRKIHEANKIWAEIKL